MKPLDLQQRPKTYFRPERLEKYLLSKVKGAVVRKKLKALFAQGLHAEAARLAQDIASSPADRATLERLHPMYMGGNYLPDSDEGEVEIARISIRSTTFDVTSVYARLETAPSTTAWWTSTAARPCRETPQGSQPMTLVELAAFFLDAWPLQEVLESNFEGDVGGALDFFSADSDFYPDLDRLLRERTCAFFPGRKGGDACPFCEHFNVPPAADVCEHAVAWVWDGQAEALGGGRAFAQALTDLRDAILAAGETSTAASILAALGEFDPVRADLLEAATGGLQQALELTAQAQAGDGWSTEGMLSGSGHSICIPEPDALEALVGHCRALVAASALEVQTQGRGGQVDLESLRPATAPSWCLAASGFWSQDVYHGGHVAYFLAQVAPGTWLLDRVVRNAILDDVTQEDVDEGRLNDDQIQAMWGSTLDEAQSFEHRQIVAACTGAAAELSNTDIAAILYRPACDADCQEIDEPDSRKGLLAL